MDYSQFCNMLPELMVLVVFLIVFLFDVFGGEKAGKALTPLTFVLMLAATIGIWFVPTSQEAIFGGMYVNSQVCLTIKGILNMGVVLVILQAARWTDTEGAPRRGEFFELMLVTLFGMYLMISARHFLLFIIGLEAASLPLAAMVAFNKAKYESSEAAIKYIMTAVFSSAILMMGLSFTYGAAGSMYFSDIAAKLISNSTNPLVVCAVVFVIAGLGFKLSLVPFHLWTADVYQGAPTAVTAYLSVISKGAAAFALFIILTQVFGALYPQVWEWVMYGLIILTITVGNLFAIRQRNLKRFMAFSSVSQAGYIMLGIVAASTVSMTSMLFYILVYVFSNLGVFAVISAIEDKTGRLDMDDYNGLHKTNPWLALTMTLALFSLAGIPPFAGFFSKFMIFTAATQCGTVAMYMLVLVALINTIISLYYYLLVVKAMWISTAGEDGPLPAMRSTCVERLGMYLCVAGILGLGIFSCVYSWLSAASQTL